MRPSNIASIGERYLLLLQLLSGQPKLGELSACIWAVGGSF